MATDEKTHAATPYHREQARKEGRMWQSQDAQNALGLLAVSGAILSYLGWAGPRLVAGAHDILAGMGHPGGLGAAAAAAGRMWLTTAVPLTLGIMVWNFLIQGVLRGFRFTFTFPFDTERLNPVQGLTRLFSRQTLWELGKGFIKLLFLAALAVFWIKAHLSQMTDLANGTLISAVFTWGQWLWQLFLLLGFGFLLMGVADAVWQHRQFEQTLKMTTQELRDELKNTEGNPRIRARRRQLRRRLVTNSLKAVRTATVVVVNPTHVAVAIQWAPHQESPPLVVAKGIDETALVIRGIAADANVPIVENPPLARSLFPTPVGQAIPEFTWRPMAVVLAYILRHHPPKESR